MTGVGDAGRTRWSGAREESSIVAEPSRPAQSPAEQALMRKGSRPGKLLVQSSATMILPDSRDPLVKKAARVWKQKFEVNENYPVETDVDLHTSVLSKGSSGGTHHIFEHEQRSSSSAGEDAGEGVETSSRTLEVSSRLEKRMQHRLTSRYSVLYGAN